MKGKQFIIGFILGALLFGSVSTLAATKIIEAEYNDIKIQVNGKEVKTDVEPFVMDGRTMVPVRFIAEELGKEVNFDEDTSTVKINDKAAQQSTSDNKQTSTIIKDGIPVYIVNGIEYVRPRDIYDKYTVELKKFDIVWDENNKKFNIIKIGDSSKILIDSVPYKTINSMAHIEYQYFKDNILPLAK